MLVKEVKEKVLPEATDEWAAEASEFDTLAELRDDLRERSCGRSRCVQAQMALRERTLEALVDLVADEPPESLVETEVRERLHDLGHRLEAAAHRPSSSSCQARAATEAGLLAELRADAARAVRARPRPAGPGRRRGHRGHRRGARRRGGRDGRSRRHDGGRSRRRLDRAGRLPAVRSDQEEGEGTDLAASTTSSWSTRTGTPVPGRPAARRRSPGAREADDGRHRRAVADEAGHGERGSEDVQAEERATVEAES